MNRPASRGSEFLSSEASTATPFTPEDLSDEQKQLAATIEQFVFKEILPNVARMENHDLDVLVRLVKRSGDLGLLMVEAPKEYGGLEMNKVTGMVVAEGISRYAAFLATSMVQTGIGLLPLVYYGTGAQKEKYIPRLIAGEWIAAYCLTEPDSGSDVLGARTTAALSADGTHYLLNGTKQFITNAAIADLLTVFAKIDRVHFTAFLVERSFPGVSVGPEEKKMGLRGSSTAQVIFDDARVPVENVLGEIGRGHKIAFNVLNVGRLKLGAAVTGTAKAALVEGAKYANVRKQFGLPIGRFGAIREKIADVTAAIFASESLVYRLAGMVDDRLEGTPRDDPDYYGSYQKGIEEFAAECAAAKVFCSEMLARTVDEVLQIHGGYGFLEEYAAERFYRDERVNRIYEGTNEINRLLVARTLLRRVTAGGGTFVAAVRNARDVVLGASPGVAGAHSAYPAEYAFLENMKSSFFAIVGAASERFGNAVKDEQEVLGAVADIAINILAIESGLMRAEKVERRLAPDRKEVLDAIVGLLTYQFGEAAATAVRRAAHLIGEIPDRSSFLEGIRKLSRYDARELLRWKRRVADAVLSSEKYPFGH